MEIDLLCHRHNVLIYHLPVLNLALACAGVADIKPHQSIHGGDLPRLLIERLTQGLPRVQRHHVVLWYQYGPPFIYGAGLQAQGPP